MMRYTTLEKIFCKSFLTKLPFPITYLTFCREYKHGYGTLTIPCKQILFWFTRLNKSQIPWYQIPTIKNKESGKHLPRRVRPKSGSHMSREQLAARIPLPASRCCGPVHYSPLANNRTCLPCFVFYANNDAFCLKYLSMSSNCAKRCGNFITDVEPNVSHISMLVNKCLKNRRRLCFH